MMREEANTTAAVTPPERDKNILEENMRQYWNYRSETYDFSDEGYRRIAFNFGRFIPGRNKKVLDVGCGTGLVTAAMCSLGHQVAGVDLTEGMLTQAEKNLKLLGFQAELLCTAADSLPFADHSFDAVVSRWVTWALPDPERTFREWKRVLKPDGILIYEDADHYRYLFDEDAVADRERYRQLSGVYLRKNYDSTLCDNTASKLPLNTLKRPFEWDEAALPRLGFDIVAEEINFPQKKLKYGIAEGYCTSFIIAAMKTMPGEIRHETPYSKNKSSHSDRRCGGRPSERLRRQ